MRLIFVGFFYICSLLPLWAQAAPRTGKRSIDDIFPGIAPAVRQAIFSNDGYSKSAENIPRSSLVGSGQDGAFTSGIDRGIIESVFANKPAFLVESIKVIPGSGYSLLDVYNALGNIRGLKGRLYNSFTRNERVPLFEDVTRIEGPQKNNPVADPPDASRIPLSETIYMRLKDANFGNSYYRANITLFDRGLCYNLTNNKNISYFFITVMKEERFTMQLYFEVISEGVLIYSLAGADVSDFVSSRVDMSSAINKRLSVIISWAAEGIAGRGGARNP